MHISLEQGLEGKAVIFLSMRDKEVFRIRE